MQASLRASLVVACVVTGKAAAQDVSALGLVLGRHTLENVVAVVGPARQVHTGDAGESESSVCYRTSSGEVLAFASNSEMAVPPLQLTAIRLGKVSQLQGACSPLTGPPVRFSNGIGLGMTRRQIEAALGDALQQGPVYLEQHKCVAVPFKKGTEEYDRWANAPLCFEAGEAPHSNVCVSLAVQLENGRAVWLEASRVESVC